MPAGLSRLLVPLTKPASTVQSLLSAHGIAAQASAGVYSLLPLGLRMQQKIEAIIRKEMAAIGAQELALSTLVDPNLWRTSGRLKEKPNPELLFTSTGKHLLEPTGEEQIAALVGSRSYKTLPLLIYQITRKFRNELRPRGGLLRTKEFVMKDLYSVAATREEAWEIYNQVRNAYNNIFDKLGVPYLVADSDSGDMGGSLSHEYHYACSEGEDTLVHCGTCKSTVNLEKAVSVGEPAKETCMHTIELEPGCTVEVEVPAGRKVNEILVKNAAQTDGSPLLKDVRVESSGQPLVEVVEGESCTKCGHQLKLFPGVEVGHTFYLGTRYSEPFGTVVTMRSGDQVPLEMGSYGIGVSRVIAAVAAKMKDEHGLRWPASIAPYSCICVSHDHKTAKDIATKLEQEGIDTVYEDRTESLGHALRLAREAGYPVVIVAGRDYHSNRLLELQDRRAGITRLVDLEGLAADVRATCMQC